MTTISPTLSITLSQRRWRCVLDPLLALSQHGLLISQQLGDVLELWASRALWDIMDSSRIYLQHPDYLSLPAATSADPQALTHALQDWEEVRFESDLAGLNLYWIGDAVSQSLLPDGVTSDIIESYEALAQALESQHPPTLDLSNPIVSAIRDAIAATATLKSAFLMTVVDPSSASTDSPSNPNAADEPAICSILNAYGVSCQQVDKGDRFVMIEREHLQALAVQSGLSPLMWSGMQLAVLHLLLPNINHFLLQNRKDKNHLLSQLSPEESWDFPAEKWQEDVKLNTINPWENAQAFWFLI